MIFQDPISSLNPRLPIWKIVAEGLEIHGEPGDHRAMATDLLGAVGIDTPGAADRRPDGFSGGQCQRISIARSLILQPEILVCDEPVSALDVSVQAQILNLLEDMKAQFGLSLLFISHDLSVVRNVSDRVAIMYLGKFCELGDVQDIFERPAHPYTLGLLSSVPSLGGAGKGPALRGELPSPIDPPSGCRFRTRCQLAQDICIHEEPTMLPVSPGQAVACHFPIGGRRL
jgi:peptide/nickel transport system ATP-binding protein